MIIVHKFDIMFKVREHPLYHLINAKVNKDQGNVTEAIKTLQTAMILANTQVKKFSFQIFLSFMVNIIIMIV